jgi:ABC-type sugar transport system ATPase subunit
MAQVLMKDLNKSYDDVKAVKDVNLHIRDKEFMVLVGPSGCGKSTTLRMVAGLEEISAGQIIIGERVVNDLPPKDRDIAMVFQNYALYPHMSVRDNMSFGLRQQRIDRSTIRQQVNRGRDAGPGGIARASSRRTERWPTPARCRRPCRRPQSGRFPDGRAALQS